MFPTSPHKSKLPTLYCSKCGNDGIFVQVMKHVENLVDANHGHLHQVIGDTDSYYCRQCGELIWKWED